jgi:hypothetical protein
VTFLLLSFEVKNLKQKEANSSEKIELKFSVEDIFLLRFA